MTPFDIQYRVVELLMHESIDAAPHTYNVVVVEERRFNGEDVKRAVDIPAEKPKSTHTFSVPRSVFLSISLGDVFDLALRNGAALEGMLHMTDLKTSVSSPPRR